MTITTEIIIMVVAFLGSAFGVYHSIKKVGDNIKLQTKEEFVWRTNVENDLKTITTDVKEIKTDNKENRRDLQDIINKQLLHSKDIDKLKSDVMDIQNNIKHIEDINKS